MFLDPIYGKKYQDDFAHIVFNEFWIFINTWKGPILPSMQCWRSLKLWEMFASDVYWLSPLFLFPVYIILLYYDCVFGHRTNTHTHMYVNIYSYIYIYMYICMHLSPRWKIKIFKIYVLAKNRGKVREIVIEYNLRCNKLVRMDQKTDCAAGSDLIIHDPVKHKTRDLWLLDALSNWTMFCFGLSQWETTLQCNVISHWLSPCPEWSLILMSVEAGMGFFIE